MIRLITSVILCTASAAAFGQALTVPNTFSAGQTASAAAVNANFSAVATAVNNNATAITALQGSTAATAPVSFTTSPIAAAVNSTVTVNGQQWTITKFAVPAYDSDTIYDISFPAPPSSTGSFSSNIDVQGTYPNGPTVNANYGNGARFVTTISGFTTYISESFYYYASLSNQTATSPNTTNLSSFFNAGLNATVILDSHTAIFLSFGFQTPAVATTSGQITTATADATTDNVLAVYPPALNAAARTTLQAELRSLLSYVAITPSGQ